MPADPGDIGYGATLSYSDTSGGAYTAVAKVVDVVPPKYAVPGVNATHHGSTNATEEKRPGLIDPGEITFKILLAKAQYNTLDGLLRLLKYWKITWPLATGESSASQWICYGFLAELAPTLPLKDPMECDGKIILSGKPTFTQGS